MGNQQCCQAGNKGEDKIQKIQHDDYHPQILPELSQPIKKVLNQKKPFEQQLKAQPQKVTRQYENDFYQGPVDIANRPAGYGKMYRHDGSLVISHFKEGKSEGPSIFIFSDGSYYEGNLSDNKAQDQNGKFVSDKLQYEGGFHQNSFNGKGKQIGAGYSFQGQYVNGRRESGTLRWQQNQKQYQFNGGFNEEFQFEGQGQLKQENIGAYKGSFKNGSKQGTGIYSYTNGMRYEGDYKKGLKHGVGTIYNYDNTVAYSGSFSNDLPNGEGYIIENGKKVFAQFKDGIDILTLTDAKETKPQVVQKPTVQQPAK